MAITLAEPREHRLLENIERVTGQQIEVEKVPTITDLRNRRMELTLSLVREELIGDADDLDRYRTIVETLTDEADLFQVALAAVKLAHEAANPADADEEDIPEAKLRRPREDRDGEYGGRRSGYDRVSRAATTGAPSPAAGPARAAPAAGATSCVCSSRWAGPLASDRATSSGPSPARRACRGATSAPSRSPRSSRWSRCRPDRSTR